MKKIRKIAASLVSSVVFTVCLAAGTTIVKGSEIYIVSAEDNRFSYCVNTDGSIKIKATEGAVIDEEAFSIPSTIDGKNVTAIADRAFIGQQDIKSVVIPESITQLGNNAFSNCYALEKVDIKGVLTDIGAYPFFAAPYEDALEKSGDYVILNNDILYDYTGTSQNIIIPDGIRVISANLFTHLEDLRDFEINYVSIPDSVEYICTGAFYNCNSINDVNMGIGIKNIGENAFTADDMTIIGYYETYAQTYATDAGFDFEPVLEYGKQSDTVYAEFSNDFRQYYFTDETEFSREGVYVYRRNYNGEKVEVTDWEYSSDIQSLLE